MKCPIARVLTLALVLGLGTGIAPAQNSTSSVPLGDLARQLKAQRAKPEGKSKVFTNDDLAALPPSGEQSAASPAKSSSTTAKEAKSGEKPAKETSGNEAGKESAKAPTAETGEQTHGEKYYRERMSKLQDRLEIDQRELSVLEQKLGQNQMQYYPDPNKGLLQEPADVCTVPSKSMVSTVSPYRHSAPFCAASCASMRSKAARSIMKPSKWLVTSGCRFPM